MMRIGLQIPNFTYPGVPDDQLFQRVADIATTAEGSGFDSVWVMDHFYQLPLLGPPTEPMLECYATLSGLAARTSQVRLGAMVTGVTYRNPALLAKTVTTLDVISSGRAILGLGAAWFEPEHEGYGFDFPAVGERMDRLEEALQICRAMFTEEAPSFEGRYYRINEALNSPRPVTPGGPPVLVGGTGEKRTLKAVAQYADACNIMGDPAECKRLLGVLDDHCAAVGRDPSEIIRTRLSTIVSGSTHDEAMAKRDDLLRERGMDPDTLPPEMQDLVENMLLTGGPDEIGEKIGEFRAAGLDGMIWSLPDAHVLDSVALTGEIVAKAMS